MQAFSKVVRLGTIAAGYPKAQRNIFAKIEYSADGKLSISGTVGPMANGDAHGSSGQFIMGFKEYDDRGGDTLADIRPAPQWDAEKIKRFFDAWDAWHLNDMRAGCPHQRGAEWDTSRKVEIVYYGLTREALDRRTTVRHGVLRRALANEIATLTATDRALAEMEDWYKDRTSPPDADSPLSGCYEVKKRETKTAGWVSPSEHPSGLLGKPCAVCGYKYGTSWLREEVPADVVEWLRALPETDVKPAWV